MTKTVEATMTRHTSALREPVREVTDRELDLVSGGKPNPQPFNWEHYFDKASP